MALIRSNLASASVVDNSFYYNGSSITSFDVKAGCYGIVTIGANAGVALNGHNTTGTFDSLVYDSGDTRHAEFHVTADTTVVVTASGGSSPNGVHICVSNPNEYQS